MGDNDREISADESFFETTATFSKPPAPVLRWGHYERTSFVNAIRGVNDRRSTVLQHWLDDFFPGVPFATLNRAHVVADEMHQ